MILQHQLNWRIYRLNPDIETNCSDPSMMPLSEMKASDNAGDNGRMLS
jgi:hypothetical protein